MAARSSPRTQRRDAPESVNRFWVNPPWSRDHTRIRHSFNLISCLCSYNQFDTPKTVTVKR